MNSSLKTTLTAFGSHRSHDDLLDRFDQCWLAGKSPRIEDYLTGIASEDLSHIITELVEIDAEYRLDRLEQVDPQKYHTQFPEHVAAVDRAFTRLKESREGLEPRFRLRDGVKLSGLIIGLEIGRGGVAVVYRVLDAELLRPLALKTLLDERTALKYRRDAISRLQEEAALTAKLSHPGVPPVHSVGELPDGRPFFCMRLIEGETFAQILHRNPDDIAGHLRIFAQVAQILAAAHQQQIIHRDLKPSNVMVGRYGEIQLMDWGMGKELAAPHEDMVHMGQIPTEHSLDMDYVDAKSGLLTLVALDTSVDISREISSRCEVLGTLAYMPPEQARGEVDLHDCRTDVFALGALLCQILIHRPPYRADTTHGLWKQACEASLNGALESIGNSQVDQELKNLARCCLTAAPSSRPANAQVVAHAMEDYFRSVENRIEVAKIERAQALVQAAAEHTRASLETTRRRIAIALCISLFAALVITIMFVVADTVHRHNAQEVQRKHDRERAANLTSALLLAPPEAVPYAIEALRPLQSYVQSELTSKIADESVPPSQQLHAALALTQFGQDKSWLIAMHSLNAAPEECSNIVTALVDQRKYSVGVLRDLYNELDRDAARARIAILLLYLGHDSEFVEIASHDQNGRLILIQTMRTWHGNTAFLLSYLRQSSNPESQATIFQALVACPPTDPLRLKDWSDGICQLQQKTRSAYLHSSMTFLASRWDMSLSNELTKSNSSQQLCRTPSGLTLLRVQPGTLVRKLPNNQMQTVELTKPFWLTDREVSMELYSQFVNQRQLKSANTERGISWHDAVQFCNWLSEKEFLQPCYVARQEGTKQTWEWDRSANGYRLPTEAEWELAARELPKPSTLSEYAVFNQAVAADSATKLPNSLGFFDMYGNLQEWCYDGWGNHEPGTKLIDPIGKQNGSSRVRCGLSYRHSLAAFNNSSRSFGAADDRNEECGLRIARSIPEEAQASGPGKTEIAE